MVNTRRWDASTKHFGPDIENSTIIDDFGFDFGMRTCGGAYLVHKFLILDMYDRGRSTRITKVMDAKSLKQLTQRTFTARVILDYIKKECHNGVMVVKSDSNEGCYLAA